MDAAVETRGALALSTYELTKRFGEFVALDQVSMAVAPGTVHALLGENGAGKSTLVKCLVGFHRADGGSVLIDSRETDIPSPQRARELGIGMVYQHFTLVPSMTVAENLAMARGGLPARIDWRREIAALDAFMASVPFRLDPRARVADLSAGEKQKTELLKQLYARNRFLILDEPTSVLTPEEADELLDAVRSLAHAGRMTALLITHKFREVERFADAVTVLRRGRLVGGGLVSELDADRLAVMMVGEAAAAGVRRAADQAGSGAADAADTPAAAAVSGAHPSGVHSEVGAWGRRRTRRILSSAGRAGVTACPSASSSRAVPRTASATSGCTGAPSRVVSISATRSRPRLAPGASTPGIGSVHAGAL